MDFYERLLDAMLEENIDIFCSEGCCRELNNIQIAYYFFTDSVLFEGRDQIDFLMAKTLAKQHGDLENEYFQSLAAPWDKLYKLSFLRKYQLGFDTTLHPMEDFLFNFIAFDHARRVEAYNYIGYHYRRQVATASTNRFNPRMPSMSVAFVNSLNDYARHMEPNKLIQNAISARTITCFNRSARFYFFIKTTKILTE